MKKYKVIKDLFKLSEQKDYIVGDTIELSIEEANELLKFDLIEEIKKDKK